MSYVRTEINKPLWCVCVGGGGGDLEFFFTIFVDYPHFTSSYLGWQQETRKRYHVSYVCHKKSTSAAFLSYKRSH